MTSPVTIPTLYKMKEKGEKIVALTAYDYPLARLVDTSGVYMILMGGLPGHGGAGSYQHASGDHG